MQFLMQQLRCIGDFAETGAFLNGKNADKKSCATVVIPVLKLFFASA